jgi:iron only hydrogenase large subunit-like protein
MNEPTVRSDVISFGEECQGCYRCIRECPVKAIRVERGQAAVIPELCVACGRCVEVCPFQAVKPRLDLPFVKRMIASGRRVYASMAPTWACEFPGLDSGSLVAALKKLGFTGVGETALGAREVCESLAKTLSEAQPGLFLSTTCPSVVSYVERYLPELLGSLSTVPSPVEAHCRIFKERVDPEGAVVFIGPCIARKDESDRSVKAIDAALTFRELRRWLHDESVAPEKCVPGPEDHFFPEPTGDGFLYPVEGGMCDMIRENGVDKKVRFVTVSGLQNLRRYLRGLSPEGLGAPVFLECFACLGGCINGPGGTWDEPGLLRRNRVEAYANLSNAPRHTIFLEEEGSAMREDEMKEALRRIGKTRPEDEVNCGGCGYASCRELAAALALGRAEPEMCVIHMRNQAQKKANALLRTMPSGVVIVDKSLHIVECNERFARLFGESAMLVYRAEPGLKGCILGRILPFTHLFELVLEKGQDIHLDHYRTGETLLDITLFPIEPGETVGAVMLDVTHKELKRDKIAQRAAEVIERNILTVQEIACRLGEHMADTEMLLRSIAEGYSESDEDVSQEDAR